MEWKIKSEEISKQKRFLKVQEVKGGPFCFSWVQIICEDCVSSKRDINVF